MKKLYLLALPMLAAALTLNSCSKTIGGDDDDNGNGSGKLVKTTSCYYGNNNTYACTITYDSQSRIQKVTDAHNNVTTYVYGSSKITSDSHVYTLDANGYVTKEEYNDNVYTTNYSYSGGYLSKATYDDNSWSNHTWSGGNLIKTVYTDDETNTSTSIGTYGDKANKLNIALGPLFAEGYVYLSFKGHEPKNLPTKAVTEHGGDTYTENYIYTFDADGYPTQIVVEDENGDLVNTIIITYY